MKNNNTKSIFTRISQLAAIPGNKSAIVRLCLVALTLVGGLFLTVALLPPIGDGFGDWLLAILTGVFCSIMGAALLWGFAKWTGFLFPKALAGAHLEAVLSKNGGAFPENGIEEWFCQVLINVILENIEGVVFIPKA